jgi:hypothetical protein
MVIRRIGPLSCARLAGFLYGAIGLVVGAVVSVIAMLGGIAADDQRGALLGAMFGIGAIVVLPMFYAVLGFATTLLGAWLYNVAAGFMGGVELDVQ